MPVCRENYPFVCFAIKSHDNVPIEFAIGINGSVRFVFLNFQSRKHQHQQTRSRLHVFTALLDNVSVHRAAASKLTIQKPRGPRLRVQRIVITRLGIRSGDHPVRRFDLPVSRLKMNFHGGSCIESRSSWRT